jgi:RND family efflux transporter MFP subunit
MSNPATTETRDAASAPSNNRLLRIGAGVLVVVLLLAAGFWPRMNRQRRAIEVARAAESELPTVAIARAELAAPNSEVLLPGNTEAVTVARIYARSNGYLRQRFADIGSLVKQGQVLATVESPETDQELEQARANAEQARANAQQVRANLQQSRAVVNQAKSNLQAARANEEIAGTTHKRWYSLVAKGVLPRQSGDERRSAFEARQAESAAAVAGLSTAEANVVSQEANVKAADAAVNAQLANVRRLERLQGFQRIVAPFDGVITERNVEQGDLVSATGGDKSLFSIAQARTLRIQVNVPQSYAVDIRVGQDAEVLVRERPGQIFAGKVARTANALDATSRTLLVEVQVDNSKGDLLPGMYSQVKFALTRSRPTVLIPADTLIADAKGTRVVTLRSGNRLKFANVQVGRDLGTQIEVMEGLNGSETLVRAPSDTMVDGQEVQVAKAQGGKS